MASKSANGSASKAAKKGKSRKANGASKSKHDGVAAKRANGAQPEARDEARDEEEAPEARSEKSGKAKLQFESMLARDEAASYFEAIVKGLRKGSIHFHQSDDSVTLSPAEHVGVEVKASQKNGREKLTFELMWRTDRGSELTIVAGDARASH